MSDALALQSPVEDLDYTHDWTNDMQDVSPEDSISTSAWTLEGQDNGSPSPSTHDASLAGNVTRVFVKNLNAGETYSLRNDIITSGGRTFSHSWTIRCAYR